MLGVFHTIGIEVLRERAAFHGVDTVGDVVGVGAGECGDVAQLEVGIEEQAFALHDLIDGFHHFLIVGRRLDGRFCRHDGGASPAPQPNSNANDRMTMAKPLS